MCMALKALRVKLVILLLNTFAFVEQIRGGEENNLKKRRVNVNYFQQILSRRIVGTIETILNLMTKF